MIIIHETFLCKPGNASKLAKLFKEVMAENRELIHIMTDLTGDFNKVVILSKHENLAEYEVFHKKYMQGSEEVRNMKEKMKGYHDMYLSGSREIYQAW